MEVEAHKDKSQILKELGFQIRGRLTFAHLNSHNFF
jgi:hypothetical protein